MTAAQADHINLNQHLTSLLEVIQQEHEALTQQQGELLADLTLEKQALLQEIGDPKYQLLIQSLTHDKAVSPDREMSHKTIVDKLHKLRDANLVNGKLMQRQQNMLREVLGLLSSNANGDVYSQDGQPRPTGNSHSTYVRKA